MFVLLAAAKKSKRTWVSISCNDFHRGALNEVMAYSVYLSLDVIGTGRLKIEQDAEKTVNTPAVF